MKLWLLTRIDDSKIGYDEYLGFVVRAETEEEARKISRYAIDDEYAQWLCKEITVEGDPEVILDSFNAG